MGVLILDNGAGSVKAGFANSEKPKIIPNCVTKAKTVRTRAFIGDQIDDCKDFSGLFYLLPFQKGYLTNWEIEKQVWEYVFSKSCLAVDFEDTDLIITEPMFNFTSVQDSMLEILFEEYAFNSVLKCNASYLSQLKYHHECTVKPVCTLVIDSGYSFTHIVPFYKGRRLNHAIRRVDVGGKLLTNHLKEIISYRQLMVMDETYVMNQCKEDSCFVSDNMMRDMSRARVKHSNIIRDYVLPDYTHTRRGFLRAPAETSTKNNTEQVLRLNNERFTVPEVLFHPSDIGIQQIGLSEAISHVISLTDLLMRPHFTSNILLTGGNCLLPGFKQRVYCDVRSNTDCFYDVSVTLPDEVITYAWEGGKLLSTTDVFEKISVSRSEYEEHGTQIFNEKNFEVFTN